MTQSQFILNVTLHQFGRLARSGERKALAASLHRFDHQPNRIIVGAPPGQRVVFGWRGIPQSKVLAPAWRAIMINHSDITTNEPACQFARIGDRRAGGEKNGVGAIVSADSLEPA